jgi:Fe-S-cluster containining protein
LELDCQTCGACCFGPEQYVSVTQADLCRFDKRSESRYVFKKGGRVWLRMTQGHCASLRARQGHFSCRIYGIRPTVCRVVEPGGRECLDARRRRGIAQAS